MEAKKPQSIAILGAGLWGLFYLHFLKHRHPEINVTLFEKESSPGWNKTWSCHRSDIPESFWNSFLLLDPFLWTKQQVRFPRFCREIPEGYLSFSARELGKRIQTQWASSFALGREPSAKDLSEFSFVIDTRPQKTIAETCGYQKFVGIEWECEKPHGVKVPLIMDASVEQLEGYRFFYVLPLTETRLFVEDTRYSDSAEIDEFSFVEEIQKYSEKFSLVGAKEVYREKAALPIPHYLPHWQASGKAEILLGAGNGFFHPVTGYSFPQLFSSLETFDLALRENMDITSAMEKWAISFRRRTRLYYFLNRLLFLAALPHERLRIFQRFYGLDASLIQRFYALKMLGRDWIAIFMGKAPVSIRKALEVSWKGGV